MKSVQVQSPGVHAWLLSKENTALLLAMLRGRSDYREVQAGDITINNGQTQTLEQLRSRNYVREYRRTEQGWPPYVPDSAEIQEGYRLQMSPLLSIDHRMVDVALKCNIDQVERLNSVNIELPFTDRSDTTRSNSSASSCLVAIARAVSMVFRPSSIALLRCHRSSQRRRQQYASRSRCRSDRVESNHSSHSRRRSS